MDPIKLLETNLRNLSQSDLAGRIGISPQLLCDILKGRREPNEKVFRFLGIEKRVTYRKANRD
jgi:transcriptional regulator with XRE-family HTH domain